MLLNVFEGARLQARRIFFDLNNSGAEGPAPSKLLPAEASFSATSSGAPLRSRKPFTVWLKAIP